MEDKELERKLKIERVEVCVNCTLFVDCKNIGSLVECEEFVEVDREKVMVIVGVDGYAKLQSRRK
jgi:hypothetical protein